MAVPLGAVMSMLFVLFAVFACSLPHACYDDDQSPLVYRTCHSAQQKSSGGLLTP